MSWFGEKCYIHCQVSLGSLFIFPKQKNFTDEEQKRFFSVCNRMSLDFILTFKTNMPFLRVSVDSMKNKLPVWDVYDKSK